MVFVPFAVGILAVGKKVRMSLREEMRFLTSMLEEGIGQASIEFLKQLLV